MRLILTCLFVLTPLVASAAPPGELTLSSSDLERVVKDGDGRIVRRTIEHFTAGGDLRGTTVANHRYEVGRLVEIRSISRSADGALNHELISTWHYESRKGGLEKVVRVWRDAAGDETRREVATWDRDRATGNTLITTVVTGGDRRLIETRYTIEYDGKGVRAHDTSVFDARGVQTSRYLFEWRGDVTERWFFNADDEITERQLERRYADAQGRTIEVQTELFDGRDRKTGSRDAQFTYAGRETEFKTHVTTWYDAHDLATQRSTTTRAGDLKRTRWERWTPDAQ